MKNDFSEIQSEIDAMQPELVRIRRDLHRHPETGWLEMRTTAILAKELRALGYEIYTGRSVSRVCSSSMRSLRPSVESIAAKEYAFTVCALSRPQRKQLSSLVRFARPQTQSQTLSSSRA